MKDYKNIKKSVMSFQLCGDSAFNAFYFEIRMFFFESN